MSAVKGFAERLQRVWAGTGTTKHVFLLAGGTAVGQGIAVLVSPILTRFYAPQDFGVLGVFSSLLSVLLVVVSLRLELAIPLADDDETLSNLVTVSLLLVLGLSGLVALGCWRWGDLLTSALQAPLLRPYLWVLPISLFGAGVYQVLNNYAAQKKAFEHIARTKMSQGIGQAGTQLCLGLLHAGPVGLLVGDAVGRVSGSGTLAGLAWRADAGAFRKSTLTGMWRVVRRYWEFPLLSIWSSLVNIASSQLPTLLLSIFFGNSVVGLFSFGLRVLQAPLALVGQAVAQVFYSNVSDASRAGQLQGTTFRTFNALAIVGTVPLMLVGVAAPNLFSVVFGPEWRQAGVHAQWLAPWILLVFVTSPLSRLVFVLGRQGGELIFQVSLLFGRVAALWIGRIVGRADVAISLFGTVSAVWWFGYALWLMRISGTPMYRTLRVFGRELLNAGLMTLPVLVIRVWGGKDGLAVGLSLAVGLLYGWRLTRLARRNAM